MARGGQETLDVDVVHELEEFLARLSKEKLSKETIRQSRIHKALTLISDKTMQWPEFLVVKTDPILEQWTRQFGNLEEMLVELYGPGGRLHGIAEPHEISRRVSCLA